MRMDGMRASPQTSGAEGRRRLALGLALALCAGGAAAQEMPEPLTAEPGNPERGRLVVRDLGAASCLICHAMPIPEEPDHGDIGPPLHGVGARFTPAELRQRLVDPKAIDPDTVMPSYYQLEGLRDVLGRFVGRTIYTAQQIEDVVAYLATLTEDP
jgi:sulfur-oxidizing protein SoxX